MVNMKKIVYEFSPLFAYSVCNWTSDWRNNFERTGNASVINHKYADGM